MAHSKPTVAGAAIEEHVFVAPPGSGPGEASASPTASEPELAERLLRYHESVFRSTISSLSVGVVLLEPGGRIVVCNRASHEILGLSEEVFLTRTPLDPEWDAVHEDGSRFPPEELPPLLAVTEKRPVRGVVVGVLRPASRDRVWILVDSVPLFDSRGEVRQVIASYSDVSAHLRATEALRASEEQLRHAQKMDAVGRLAGAVAHDFNNLLTAILGYADLLIRNLPENDPRQHEADEIRRAAQRASALTRQLLSFSRRQILAPRLLDLRALIGEVQALMRRLLRENIDLSVTLADDTPLVFADPGQLEQVLVNLVVNARDAMTEGGSLAISTGAVTLDLPEADRRAVVPGDFVRIRVADTGCGMDESVMNQIFEPFFTTKQHGEGTGLGLTTVYGIVRQSGGAVHVESTPGHGSVFEVLLPAACGELEKPATATRSAMARGTECVLLVEDEPAVRRLAHEILVGAGYHVMAAEDPESALRLAAAHGRGIDLLVTDVIMPGMNGRQLRDELRHTRPNLRTLFISGYPDDPTLTAGSERLPLLLAKPFSAESLLRHVRQAFETPVGPA
jgi:two-component system cell cycle sensor histidine kinase/response regulator CckA